MKRKIVSVKSFAQNTRNEVRFIGENGEGETVLDCCIGSGSTGVAAVWEGRNFIGIEQSEKYFAIAEKRIADERKRPHQREFDFED